MEGLECDEVLLPVDNAVASTPPATLESCGEELGIADVPWRLALMVEKEHHYMPDPDYMSRAQRHGMKVAWRTKIIQWFFQLAKAFNLNNVTIHLAINYLDRYLSIRPVSGVGFQLTSIAALFLASKLEEIRALRIEDFVMLSDNLFEAEDLRLAEVDLLRTLDWKLHPPTVPSYVHLLLRYVENTGLRAELDALTHFFLEKALDDLWFARWRFSTVALASILCAIHRASRHRVANISAGILEQWMQSVQTELVDCGIQVDDACTTCARRMLLLDTEVKDLQTSSERSSRRSESGASASSSSSSASAGSASSSASGGGSADAPPPAREDEADEKPPASAVSSAAPTAPTSPEVVESLRSDQRSSSSPDLRGYSTAGASAKEAKRAADGELSAAQAAAEEAADAPENEAPPAVPMSVAPTATGQATTGAAATTATGATVVSAQPGTDAVMDAAHTGVLACDESLATVETDADGDVRIAAGEPPREAALAEPVRAEEDEELEGTMEDFEETLINDDQTVGTVELNFDEVPLYQRTIYQRLTFDAEPGDQPFDAELEQAANGRGGCLDRPMADLVDAPPNAAMLAAGGSGGDALAPPPAVAVVGHRGRDANGLVLISPDNIMATDELADEICGSRRTSMYACDKSHDSVAPKNYDSAAANRATVVALPFDDDGRGGGSGGSGSGEPAQILVFGGAAGASQLDAAAPTAGASSSCDEMGFKSLAIGANGDNEARVSVALTDEEVARPQARPRGMSGSTDLRINDDGAVDDRADDADDSDADEEDDYTGPLRQQDPSSANDANVPKECLVCNEGTDAPRKRCKTY